MPRKKAAQNCAVAPWLSERADCREGRFIQAGNSLFLSGAFQTLSAGSRWLYLCCCMESGGRPDFIFPQSAAKKYGIAPTSLRRGMSELIKAGFISVEMCGKVTRESNRYRFSLEWRNSPLPD